MPRLPLTKQRVCLHPPNPTRMVAFPRRPTASASYPTSRPLDRSPSTLSSASFSPLLFHPASPHLLQQPQLRPLDLPPTAACLPCCSRSEDTPTKCCPMLLSRQFLVQDRTEAARWAHLPGRPMVLETGTSFGTSLLRGALEARR